MQWSRFQNCSTWCCVPDRAAGKAGNMRQDFFTGLICGGRDGIIIPIAAFLDFYERIAFDRRGKDMKNKTLFTAIHHVAIIVSDYEKSRHFYVDLLGFPVIREHIREDKGDCKLDLGVGTGELEIFWKKDAPARLSYPEACGLRHLAFPVESVEETAAFLMKLGIKTEEIRVDPYTGRKMTFFSDPDGLPLELYEAAAEEPARG